MPPQRCPECNKYLKNNTTCTVCGYGSEDTTPKPKTDNKKKPSKKK